MMKEENTNKKKKNKKEKWLWMKFTRQMVMKNRLLIYVKNDKSLEFNDGKNYKNYLQNNSKTNSTKCPGLNIKLN